VCRRCVVLLCGALETTASLLGWTWKPGDVVRRSCLAAALSIYYIRILFTEFVFLKRVVGWSEVFTIAPWMSCIYLLLAISGGRNTVPVGLVAVIGIVLFVAGSWMNSYAEYARHKWRQFPENRGRLLHARTLPILTAFELFRRSHFIFRNLPDVGRLGDRRHPRSYARWVRFSSTFPCWIPTFTITTARTLMSMPRTLAN
jgi:hypothetical protein